MKGLATIIVVMLVVAVAFSAALLIRTFVTAYISKPVTIELIDKYCQNNTAYFVLRNGGNVSFAKNSLNCTKEDSNCTGECVVDNLPANGAGYVRVYNCSSGNHSFKLSGNTNMISLSAYCN